jgi:hypothetical protein
LQILLQEINRSPTNTPIRRAAIGAFLRVVDTHRTEWQATVGQISDELGALRRAMDQQRARVELEPKKWTNQERDAGLQLDARRLTVQLDSWRDQERNYAAYAHALSELLKLETQDFDRHKLTEELIPKRTMGDSNSVYDLKNYVVGPAAGGLVLAADGSLDIARSFERIDYPPLLASLSVRNNVQAALGSHPVDFQAMSIPKAGFAFPPGDLPTEDPIWLYASEDKQALILCRGNELRYLPIHGLHQDAGGSVHFERAEFAPGFPLHIFEDENLAVPRDQRDTWLNSWHSDSDWFQATYQTAYSNGIVALHEQFLPPIIAQSADPDAALVARFNQRRRRLAEPDFMIFANDHWNFNVRNFNPGGNHGSFLRASTHAILLLAGGVDTGVPHALEVQAPYDSLSFVPTILELMGMHTEAAKLPGRAIQEVLPGPSPSVTH